MWSTSRLPSLPTELHFRFRRFRPVDGYFAFRDVVIGSGVACGRLRSCRVYRSIYYRLRCRLFTWGHSQQWDTSEKKISLAALQPIGLKFCTWLEGDDSQNRVGANFKFPPLKNLAPLWILHLHYGQWDEKFQIDISKLISRISSRYFFTHISPEAWKLILRFSRVEKIFNSIFIHFCMFYAPFNISGTLEASVLKFSQTMYRWWG